MFAQHCSFTQRYKCFWSSQLKIASMRCLQCSVRSSSDTASRSLSGRRVVAAAYKFLSRLGVCHYPRSPGFQGAFAFKIAADPDLFHISPSQFQAFFLNCVLVHWLCNHFEQIFLAQRFSPRMALATNGETETILWDTMGSSDAPHSLLRNPNVTSQANRGRKGGAVQ